MASSTTQSHPTAPNQAKRRRLDLTSTKVTSSAGAAVTSAVGSSLFGANGTIAGAAIGSVIATVAGAVYERSLQNASEKLRETTVVVRRVPGRNGAPDSLPKDLPEVSAGAERQEADLTQAADAPDVTTAMPVIQLPIAERDDPATRTLAAPGGEEPPDDTPVFLGFGRKKLLVLGALMLTAFVVALGGMTVVESLLGRQLNGDRGTSVGSVTRTSTGTTGDRNPVPADQEPTATPTEEPTTSPEASEEADPDATTSPEASESAGSDPDATGGPDESEPEPSTEPTGDTQTGDGTGNGSGAGAAPAPTAAAND